MNPRVERRKEILINAVFAAFLLLMFYLFMEYAFTLFFPFLVAFLFALLLQRPINFITKKTPLKKGLVSVILVLLLAAAVLGLTGFLVFRVFAQAKSLFVLIYSKIENLPIIIKNLRGALISRIGFLPDSMENSVRNAIIRWTDKIIYAGTENTTVDSNDAATALDMFRNLNISSILNKPLNSIWSTAKQIPNLIVTIVVTIVSSCFMCMEYDNIVNLIKNQFSKKRAEDLSSAKQMFVSSMGKILRAYALIMLITFSEMTVGLFILSLLNVYKGGYILIIAALTALVDIFPVLGTGTVLIPWAIICFIIGKPWLGLGIAILYVCISVLRQVIEPKLVASNLGISPVLSLMGLYLGFKLFGFGGMLLTPIAFTMIKLLNDERIIHLWKPLESEKAAAPVSADAGESVEGEQEPDESEEADEADKPSTNGE